MDSFWMVLGLALLPAAGNFTGGMLAEHFDTNKRRLNQALHAAAGIVLAIVAVELIPEALARISPWWVALAFGLGGLAYIAIDKIVDRLQDDSGQGTDENRDEDKANDKAKGKAKGKDKAKGGGSKGMWMIYIAVATDLASDGLMIGSGSAVSSQMALALALGQVLADVPEGYATIANMKEKGVPRGRRILLSASFAIPVLSMAALAFFVLRGQSDIWKMSALAFVAGLLALAAVEDMISEAHESKQDTASSLLLFTAGFVLFIMVSAGVGG